MSQLRSEENASENVKSNSSRENIYVEGNATFGGDIYIFKQNPTLSLQDTQPQASTEIKPSGPKIHSWQRLKRYIERRPFASFESEYAGNKIKCNGRSRLRRLQLHWDCECFDFETGISEECIKYESQYGACEHALAELMRRMVSQGTYPVPSDADSMKTGCRKIDDRYCQLL